MEELKLQLLNNKKWLIIPLILVLMGGISYYTYGAWDNHDNGNSEVVLEKNESVVYTESEMAKIEVKETKYISVDIKGRVKKPGVYRLDVSLDRRISDVVTMAGGLLNDADTSVTNLSKKLSDEMVIIIYSKDEVKRFLEINEEEEIKIDACNKECDSCIQKGDVSNNNTDNQDKEEKPPNDTNNLININTASKDELMTLTGIGESKAVAIIDYRKKTPFETIEDIMKVDGIGEKVYNEIKNYITV